MLLASKHPSLLSSRGLQKALTWLCAAFLLSFSAAAWSASQKKEVFGVVNMQKIILTVEEGIDARAKLEKQIRAKEAEFMEEKKKLDGLQADWQKQMAILSEDAKRERQQEFQQKFMDLRNAEVNFQNDIKRKEAEETQNIAKKAAKIAEEMAVKQDLAAVFELNSTGLIYAKNKLDLTDNIITEYNKKHGGMKISRKP